MSNVKNSGNKWKRKIIMEKFKKPWKFCISASNDYVNILVQQKNGEIVKNLWGKFAFHLYILVYIFKTNTEKSLCTPNFIITGLVSRKQIHIIYFCQ